RSAGNIAGEWSAGFCRVAGGKPAIAWQRIRATAWHFAGVTAVTFALPAARTAWRTNGIAGITQEREWPDSGDGGDGEWQIYHAGGDGWLSQSTCRCAYSDAGRSCGISLYQSAMFDPAAGDWFALYDVRIGIACRIAGRARCDIARRAA